MTAGNSYLGTPEHLADRAVVLRANDTELAEKIRNYTANSADVLAWYGTDDPCYEDLSMEIIGRLASSSYSAADDLKIFLKKTVDESTLHEAASLTILADIAGVVDEPASTPWTESKHPLVTSARHSPASLAEGLVRHIAPRIQLTDFDKLYAATDSLHEAGVGLGYLRSVMLAVGLDSPLAAEYGNRSDRYVDTSRRLASLVVRKAIQSPSIEDLIASRPILHKMGTFICNLGLETSMRQNTAGDMPTTMNEHEQKVIEFLSSFIMTSFLDLEKSKVLKGQEKGDLHELLFLLDLNYLFASRRPESRTWQAKASPLRYDAPKIGYPTVKRGHDFIVTNGYRALPIQLKSSTHDDAEYHPRIQKIEEMNFQEVDKRRLRAHLQAYRDWVDSGFNPRLQGRIEKYILPSAQEAYDYTLADDNMRDSDRIIQAVGNTLSRAEIRRIKRNAGDFSRRKSKK